jgi:hypothetical protein
MREASTALTRLADGAVPGDAQPTSKTFQSDSLRISVGI